jgi:hypothetical protein
VFRVTGKEESRKGTKHLASCHKPVFNTGSVPFSASSWPNVEPVGLGHIVSYEVCPALHRICDKSNVAGQPIKAANQEHGAALPALGKGGE